ncbi:hypothetical protein BGZ59_011814 [Podila verticillata]|nr:hypothetical protein BGZ59_011814 [Podila verticillata]KAI9235944.1 MAG: hypothetical protein BYD32DRAFT_419976 [Podila humilis]KFH68995.1 hypothetical protein MVEG_05797 [Podila verticillata NRRL 6337]
MSQEAPAQSAAPDIQRHLRPAVISYNDMDKLMRHFQNNNTINVMGRGHCFFFEALAATAFTLWLTFDEVLQLKRKHVRFHRPGPAVPQRFYVCTVTVPFRHSDDPSQPNVYEIYPQPDEPNACLTDKLLNWIGWLQHEHNPQRPLNDEEFLFPLQTAYDEFQLESPSLATDLLWHMNTYASDASVVDLNHAHLDPQCFRRGGALHRLHYAQETWSYEAIKWWGGWSEEEPAEDIARYLLDELPHSASFGDMLSYQRSKIPGYTGVVRRMLEELVKSERLESAIQSMDSKHMSALAKIENDRKDIAMDRHSLWNAITGLRSMVDRHFKKTFHAHASQISAETPSPASKATHAPDQPQQEHVQPPQQEQVQSLQQPSPPPQHSLPPQQPHPSQQSRPSQQSPPPQQSRRKRTAQDPPSQPPSQIVPAVSGWKEALKQWWEGDPDNGLTVPLCNWTSDMKTAQKHEKCYETRQKIKDEYENCGRDGRSMNRLWRELNEDKEFKAAVNLRIEEPQTSQKKQKTENVKTEKNQKTEKKSKTEKKPKTERKPKIEKPKTQKKQRK